MEIKSVKFRKDGFVYDPAEHDGVAFEDLPDDWKCPRLFLVISFVPLLSMT